MCILGMPAEIPTKFSSETDLAFFIILWLLQNTNHAFQVQDSITYLKLAFPRKLNQTVVDASKMDVASRMARRPGMVVLYQETARVL
jgi:hypothetical protein